jgi:hypothetical protein
LRDGAAARRLRVPGRRYRVDPLQRTRDDFVSSTLDRLITILTRTAQPEAGVVDVEPALETGRGAGARIEDQRSHERRRAIAGAMRDVRQVRHAVGQRHAEIADAVKRRIGAGQNRRVRHRGDRRLRVGARVDDRLLRERVERRCQPAGGSEKPHPIRSDGVEGDEEDVRFGCACSECSSFDRLRMSEARTSTPAESRA